MNPLRYVAAFIVGVALTFAAEWKWRRHGPHGPKRSAWWL